ncbi:hypothetical protein [Paracoccus sp. (in: a-proteobacteria)]|uniref:hypothetical protein n=1 Tax=Paracoccus sp. TaxID=267 RepID=UPI0028AE90EE|nr:hypothetical protein [Paracoccus sp. (in: a-proteobacteria)]
MTKYEPGIWHGWNGGEMPVHPKTVVEVATPSGSSLANTADCWVWDGDAAIRVVAFRIVREYREPREWWLYPLPGVQPSREPREGWIHVREVIDGEDQA